MAVMKGIRALQQGGQRPVEKTACRGQRVDVGKGMWNRSVW